MDLTSPNRPPPSLLNLVLVLVGTLLFVPLLGSVAALLWNGQFAGVQAGGIGEMPVWMAAWLIVLAVFLAVLIGWCVWVLAGWTASALAERRRHIR